ncbi:MAG: hypothetical protein J6Y05_07285 [Bacteroidales bacterium]|nr:hypothetical protein [Bacteroidales bacterium]
MKRHYTFFLLALLAWLRLPCPTLAQDKEPQEAVATLVKESRRPHFLNGIAVGGDIVGPIMKIADNDWSQYEAFVRLNIYDKYFPIFELGLGEGDHEGRELDNHFKVRAPYFRIGCDYNMIKKHEGNRLFLGLRYGFSTYSYDVDSPTPLTDPYWGESRPFSDHGLDGHAHWAEAVFGLETRRVGVVSVGWDMRFKLKISQKYSDIGIPWYIPGYGRNADGIGWGGTFKILFDI